MRGNNEAGKGLLRFLVVINGANVGFLTGPKNQVGKIDMTWPLEDSIVLCVKSCDLKWLKFET